MRVARSLLPLFIASLVVAGCLAPTGGKVPTTTGLPQTSVLQPFVNPLVLDHDHNDPEEHQLSNNMELVGRDLMGTQGPPGGPGEIDTNGHYAYVALLGYGFAIVDLADPAHPKTVSTTKVDAPQTPTFGAYTADIKVDKTGNWVFLAMELSTTPGLFLYDATNKAAPKLVGFWAEPGKFLGCHMVEYAEIGGQEYVFCAPLDAAIYVGLFTPPNAAGVREIVQVGRWEPSGPKFAQWMAANSGAAAGNYALSGHDDMTFEPDPLTGKPTLFVSFWNMGVWYLDVSVPAAPLVLGSWFGEGSKMYGGQIHTTMAFKSHDGKRLVVSIPEVARIPAVFVVDATDYANPKLLSEWTAMADWGNHSGTFSTHNFQIVGDRMYLAHYHGGIWVLDLSDPAHPTPVGSYAPHEPRVDGKPYGVGAWDVVVWHGYTLTADGNGGLYVLHFATDPSGDADYTSFA